MLKIKKVLKLIVFILISILFVFSVGKLLRTTKMIKLANGEEIEYGLNAVADSNGIVWYYETVVIDEVTYATNVRYSSGTLTTEVRIPDTLTDGTNTYTVIGIGAASYTRNLFYGANLAPTHIIIPDTLQIIGQGSFYNCTSTVLIKKASSTITVGVDLPVGVTKIGIYSFYNCLGLTGNLLIPQEVTTIEAYAFMNCTGFTGNLALPNSIEILDVKAFYGCTGFNGTLTLPMNLQQLKGYAFQNCTGFVGDINIPNSVTTLGASVFAGCSNFDGEITLPTQITSYGASIFQGCSKLTGVLIIPEGVTALGSGQFYGCSSLEELVLPSTLKTIGSSCFNGCSSLSGDLVIPNSVTSIQTYAFNNCSGFDGTLTLSNSLTLIGTYAFANCTNFVGDIDIPNSVTSLGAYAFYYCYGFDGEINIGTGVKIIPNYSFYYCNNISQIYLNGAITKIDECAFGYCGSLENVFVKNYAANITFVRYWDYRSSFTIHYLECMHTLYIGTKPEGVSLVNVDTDEVLNANDSIECNKTLNFRINVEEGVSLNLSDYKLFINNVLTIPNEEGIYSIIPISDISLNFRLIKDGTDFVLREQISKINGVNTGNYPSATLVGSKYEYRGSKQENIVKQGDLVTYTITVFNEGNVAGSPEEITMYLPEGLSFVEDDAINQQYSWVKETAKVLKTNYLQTRTINALNSIYQPSSATIEVVCKVTAVPRDYLDMRLVTISEITQQTGNDPDSTANNFVLPENLETYMYEESMASTSSSYILCAEDDTDYNQLTVQRNILVEYSIEVNKLDLKTNELLDGAKFNLLDKNKQILQENVVTVGGRLNFGTFLSREAGIDIYYIKEVASPLGYSVLENKEIKLEVVKILNLENRTFDLEIKTDWERINVETEIVSEYIPIYNKEQLSKIGSGEEMTIEGKTYIFGATANYKLMNDIDLSDENWNPIQNEVNGVFEGNNKKISNLKIVTAEANTREIGLFRAYSGGIVNLTLENIEIDIKGVKSDSDGICEYNCVGGFVGFAKGVTFENCHINGEMISHIDNVGGFVGYAVENTNLYFNDCTSSVDITALASNIGGFVGTSYSFTNINCCENNGNIAGNFNNVGGFVGYAEPIGNEQLQLFLGIDRTTNMIVLNITNEKVEDEYEIELRKTNSSNLELVDGAKFTIYDENKNVIEGMEQVTVQNGVLPIKKVNIQGTGTDIYYIKEILVPEGFKKIVVDEYIKLVVRRSWKEETSEFLVEIVGNKISEEEFQQQQVIEDEIVFENTGLIYNIFEYEDITWDINKIKILNSKNKGNIVGVNFIGGFVGQLEGVIYAENDENSGDISSIDGRFESQSIVSHVGGIVGKLCGNSVILQNVNKGNITASYGFAGGIIGKTTKLNHSSVSIIDKTVNIGKILNMANTKTAVGGIIGDSETVVYVTESQNVGIINSLSAAGGILGSINTDANVLNCMNTGDIVANSNAAGGMIGKLQYEKNGIVNIENCKCIAEITTTNNLGHIGGMIGHFQEGEINIKGCQLIGCKFRVQSSSAIGGMLGNTAYNKTVKLNVNNCSVVNSDFENDNQTGYSVGNMGGIVGFYFAKEDMYISNCEVADSKMYSRYSGVGGICGNIHQQSANGGYKYGNIINCKVKNTEIIGESSGGIGGILGCIIFANINLEDCIVQDSLCSHIGNADGTAYTGQTCVGGMIGTTHAVEKLNLEDCTVQDTDILNNAYNNGANTGGLVAGGYFDTSTNGKSIFKGCKVIGTKTENVEDYPKITIEGGNLGGIISVAISAGDLEFEDCLIENINIISNASNANYGGSNTNTGGMIAFYSSEEIKLKDCKIKNSEINAKGANVGGLAACISGNLVMENSGAENVKIVAPSEGSYSGNGARGGLIGSNFSGGHESIKIDGCYVRKMQVDVGGTGFGAIAGELCQYGNKFEREISNCTVEELNVKFRMHGNPQENQYDLSHVGGIVGETQNIDINNCTITDFEIDSDATSTGGAFGFCLNLNISNCSATDGIITTGRNSHTGPNGAVGGIIGTTNSEVLENCASVNVDITSSSDHIGGIVGSENQIRELKDCRVEDSEFIYTNAISTNHERGIGGIIGNSGGNSNGQSLINPIVKNCTMIVENGIEEACDIGGITCVNDNSIIVSDADIDDVTMVNKTKNGCLGGIAGKIGSISISDSNITNLDMKMQQEELGFSHIGGIAAVTQPYSRQGDVYNSSIDGVHLEQITIETKSNSGVIAGMIAISQNTLNVTDSTIRDLDIIKEKTVISEETGEEEIIPTILPQYAAGIAGVAANTTVDNVQIYDSSINSRESSGGFVALNQNVAGIESVSTIFDSMIKDSNILSDGYSGGVLGLGVVKANNQINPETGVYSNETIVTVDNVDILTKSGSARAGGFVSQTKLGSEINNVCVQNSNIENTIGGAGGIVGFQIGTVTNNLSKLNTIIGKDAVGGITGHGNNYTSTGIASIANSKVSGCTITGAEAVGGIAGAAVPNIDNSTVTKEGTANTTITGIDKIGGIIGYGGELAQVQQLALTILNSVIEHTTINATGSNVGSIVGLGTNDSYGAGRTDIITNCEDTNNIVIQ